MVGSNIDISLLYRAKSVHTTNQTPPRSCMCLNYVSVFPIWLQLCWG